jgi:hypothetical protein
MIHMKTTLILILSTLCFPACEHGHETPPLEPSFGIYLTRDNVPPASLASRSLIEPGDEPILSLDDIVSYTWSTHTFRISDRARSMLDTFFVPVSGKSFCVCVHHNSRYCGAFWTPISSIGFHGTTIIVSRPSRDSLSIRRGYPSDSDTSMPDPRNDAEVEAILRATGKLR